MDNQKEEIDLVSVLLVCGRKLKSFFSSIFSFFMWCLRFAFKKKSYLLAALACAVVFAAFWGRPDNRKYKMETEIRINVLDAHFFNDMVTSINHMCTNHDIAGLQRAMNVNADVAEALGSVESFFYVDKLCDGIPDEVCYGEFKADTTKILMEDRLLLTLVVSDSTLIDEITKGLSYYFATNPYVMRNNKERLAQMDDGINSIKNEMVILDSLRKYEYFKKKAEDMRLEGPLIVSEKDKQLYYNDILSLEKSRDKKAYERAVMSDCINWTRGFVLVKVYNKYLPTFVYSLIVFSFIFLIIAYFISEKARIKAYLSK